MNNCILYQVDTTLREMAVKIYSAYFLSPIIHKTRFPLKVTIASFTQGS